MLRVGRRIAGVDHAKLRELLLVTSRTCDLLRFVDERIIANVLIQFQMSTEKSACVNRSQKPLDNGQTRSQML
jgi:hypothetical protein